MLLREWTGATPPPAIISNCRGFPLSLLPPPPTPSLPLLAHACAPLTSCSKKTAPARMNRLSASIQPITSDLCWARCELTPLPSPNCRWVVSLGICVATSLLLASRPCYANSPACIRPTVALNPKPIRSSASLPLDHCRPAPHDGSNINEWHLHACPLSACQPQ